MIPYSACDPVDIKHVQKFQSFADVAAGSRLEAYLLYDDEQFDPAASHKIFSYENTSEESRKVPVRLIPRQTANYGVKVRFNGFGFARLYHLELFVKQGGEKYAGW